MEKNSNSEEFRIYIESLAKKLVNGESIDQVMAIQKIANSFLPVDLDFYKIYVEFYKDPFNYPTSVGNPHLVYEILDTYFSTIANNSDPCFGNEIYEVLFGADEYDFDKLIAANSNPSISVKLLREIGNKKYDSIKPETEVSVANDTYVDNQVDAFFDIFKRQEDYDSRLSFGNKIELRKEKLQKFLNPGVRPSLKWIVKENILKRQQLILKKFTDIFGGEIDPIYQNLDKYNVLETCSELANILYPPNNAPGRITVDRRFNETAMDIINPGNKDSIPNLLAQMEVYIYGLNLAQKQFFGRPKLLELCNAILQVDVFSLNKSFPDKDQYELSGILFQCLNNPFEDERKNKNYKAWSAYRGYCNEFTRVNKISREIALERADSRPNEDLKYRVYFNQSDLNYGNNDARADTIDRILLSLQKDRNFLRKLLEEQLKEPLLTSEQILFAENTELEAKKLSELSKQEEIWYKKLEEKVYLELNEDSEQEEKLYQRRIEGLFKNDDYLQSEIWIEFKPGIDKIFAGNKRIIILLNQDLNDDEARIIPHSQLNSFWRELNINFDAKPVEEKNYSKYLYITTELMLRLCGNYERILAQEVLSDVESDINNEELISLLNIEINQITDTLDGFIVFSN
jgi:hypothetical protein